MKHTVIAFMFLFVAGAAFGQMTSDKIEVVQGPPFKESKKTTMESVIGQDQSGVYTLFAKSTMFKKTYYIARINDSMDMESMVELDLAIDGKDLFFEDIILLGDQLILFSSLTDRSGGNKIIYAQQINKSSLEPKGGEKELAVIAFETAKESKSTSFTVAISPDESKIMVYYNTPYAKGEPESFGLHVYDADLNAIWDKEVTLPYSDDLFALERVLVASNGDAYILGSELKEKKERSKSEPDGRYVILEYSDKGSKFTEYPVDLGDYFVNTLLFKTNSKGELLCSGFIRDTRSTGSSGAFFAKIDRATKTITHQSIENFTTDFIAQDLRSKDAKKTQRKADKGKAIGLRNVKARDLILREDGGIVLTGEQYWYEVITTTNAQGQRTTTTKYFYYDIIVVSVTPEGNIEWTEKVPKRQVSSNDSGRYSSYAKVVKGDKVYFIFNDNPKNLNYKGDGKWYAMVPGKSIVSLVEIDSDGRVFRTALPGGKLKGIIARPKVSAQINESDLLLYAERKSNKNMLKVRFRK